MEHASNECPQCGGSVGCVSLVVGIVKICTHHCKVCDKVWRHKALTITFSVPDMVTELERLHKRHVAFKPPHVKMAMNYLQVKIESHAASKMEKEAGVKRRRLDLWERNFMKDAVGDDYE